MEAVDCAAAAAHASAHMPRVEALGHTGAGTRAFVGAFIAEISGRDLGFALVPRLCRYSEHLDSLRDGTAYLSVLRLPLSAEALAGIEVEVLGTEPCMLAVPAGHALAARKSVRVRDIATLTLAGPGREACAESSSFWTLDERPGRSGSRRRQEVDSTEDLLAVVAAGLAVAVVPLSLSLEISSRAVCFVPLHDAPSCAVALAWPAWAGEAEARQLSSIAHEVWGWIGGRTAGVRPADRHPTNGARPIATPPTAPGARPNHAWPGNPG
jgi:DNA-binding transcriptional LysR family regulator